MCPEREARAALKSPTKEAYLEWAEIEDGGERFAAFRKLNKKAKDQLVAYCTAVTLTIGGFGEAQTNKTPL